MKTHLVLTLMATSVASASFASKDKVTTSPTDSIVIDIEEVIIVATPKENSRLRQQSLSSTSFSQQDMRNRSIASVKGLSALAPNLFLPDYGSKLNTPIYIRGIGTRTNTPAVGMYVDNMPVLDKASFDFNFSEIERVDVLRGPQSTLYGRNAMGGLIRIFTKSPFNYQGTDVRLSAATYHQYKASATHYHRISEKFAFTGSVFYDHQGGFYKNTARDNEWVDKSDEWGTRLRAIYLPSSDLKLDLTLSYEHLKMGAFPYVYFGLADATATDPRADKIGSVSYNHKSDYRRDLLTSGLNLEWNTSGFIFNSVTGFQLLGDKMNMDQDFTEANTYTILQKQRNKTLSQELIFKSKPQRRWQWTTGASLFYQWATTEAPVTFQENAISSLIERGMNTAFAGMTGGALTATIDTRPFHLYGTYKTPTLNTALFHQSTYRLVGGLSATIGLRLDYEKVKMDYNTGTDVAFSFHAAGYTATPYTASVGFKNVQSNDYFQFLPKFSLQYDWENKNNVYATVSRGYRSGGYNYQQFSSPIQSELTRAIMTTLKADAQLNDATIFPRIAAVLPRLPITAAYTDADLNLRYDPEYSWNYEVGTHLNFFRQRLTADISAFLMQTRNQQISRFAESGLGRITENTGKSRSYGVEVATRAQVTGALSLYANYGYTHATFTHYEVESGRNAATKVVTSYNGKYVPFIPRHTVSVGAQYVFELRNSFLDNIAVDASYKGAGRIYWDEANTRTTSQGFYGLLNGRVSFNKAGHQVALWINNALDKKYKEFFFTSLGNNFGQMGKPMQMGIDLRFQF